MNIFYLQINYCEDVMKIRGAKQISYEDVLFLMRRNKVRVILNFSIVHLNINEKLILQGKTVYYYLL